MDTSVTTKQRDFSSTGTVRRIPSSQSLQAQASFPSFPTHSADSSVSIQTVSSPTSSVPYSISSDGSMTVCPTLSSAEVIALAKDALRSALEENATNGMGSKELKPPGITIDMSHQNIMTFPDEVIDIIKNEIERLALSNNQIYTFPARLAECTSLRYLNVRNNCIRDFPLSICELPQLEILDMSRNKIKILPQEIGKLMALKVFSLQKNKIEELPQALAYMSSLQCLKFDGNPITFPPREVLVPQATSPPNGPLLREEFDDVTVTTQIKKFMKQKAAMDRSEAESAAEDSMSEGGDYPRPLKRVTSGRFPIKVNGTDVPDLRSPATARAPPIPSRSHYRGLSAQNAALRRPGIMPLTMGNSNERLRSNSESLLRLDNKIDRSRRMGMIPKKSTDLATVDETKNTNRYSHLRGLSHGSALQNGNSSAIDDSSRPAFDPAETYGGRTTYVRRLSSLPEKKRQSGTPDPIVEGAKGVLFAVEQVNPLIGNLMELTRDPSNKRSSLERVFFNANTHVEELTRDIREYDMYTEEDEEIAPRSNANIHRACVTCVSAYIHVCGLLSRNVESLVQNGDPRWIRHMLLLIYGSLAEVRNAGVAMMKSQEKKTETLPSVSETRNENRDSMESQNTIRPAPCERGSTPTRDRERPSLVIPPQANPRLRSATLVQHPSNLRVMTDSRGYNGMKDRSATMTSATPKSGESFASVSSSGKPTAEFTEEDRMFDKIFLALQQASEMCIRVLPEVHDNFVRVMYKIENSNLGDQLKRKWAELVQMCELAMASAESLKARLSTIKLKEPGIRSQPQFWNLCDNFLNGYTDLVTKVKELKSMTPLLDVSMIHLLRPLQKVMKEIGHHVQNSPWHDALGNLDNGRARAAVNTNGMSANPSYGVLSTPPTIALPMTPATAALGPAVQATVPSQPASASYMHQSFPDKPNFFERADQLLASANSSAYSSAFSSRTGTMTSGSFGSSLGGSFGGGLGSGYPTMVRSREESREPVLRSRAPTMMGRMDGDGNDIIRSRAPTMVARVDGEGGDANGSGGQMPTGQRYGGKVIF